MPIDLKLRISGFISMAKKNCSPKPLILVISTGGQMLAMPMTHLILKLMLATEIKDLSLGTRETVNKSMSTRIRNSKKICVEPRFRPLIIHSLYYMIIIPEENDFIALYENFEFKLIFDNLKHYKYKSLINLNF